MARGNNLLNSNHGTCIVPSGHSNPLISQRYHINYIPITPTYSPSVLFHQYSNSPKQSPIHNLLTNPFAFTKMDIIPSFLDVLYNFLRHTLPVVVVFICAALRMLPYPRLVQRLC